LAVNSVISNRFSLQKTTMKKLLIILTLFISSNSFGQQWKFSKGGNAFDGFYRSTIISLINDSSYLAILSQSEELKLRGGFGGENTIDKLSISISFKEINNPNSLLMSFDNEKKVYNLNFLFHEEKSIAIFKEAYSNNYSELYNKFSILNLFKSKKNVHFRMSNGNDKIDASFSLIGFTSSVDKVAVYSNSDEAERYNSVGMISFISLLPNEIRQQDVVVNCVAYLEENYGKYFLNLIDSIELIKNYDADPKNLSSEEFLKVVYPKLIFKNRFGLSIATIESEFFIKNALYFSGIYKKYDDGKLLKDEDSLKKIYNLLTEKPTLIEDISFDEFTLVSKAQISKYHKIFKNYYDEDKLFGKECNLKVFSESWGFKP